MSTYFFTGHRPQKLGGFNPCNPTMPWLHGSLTDVVCKAMNRGATMFYAGGALGFDQLCMEVVLQCWHDDSPLPLTIARPFPSQHVAWPIESQQYYADLCWRCVQADAMVVDVNDDPYSAQKMQDRNIFMADRGDYGIAAWDGSAGGTANCVGYALKQGRPVYQLDPMTHATRWIRPTAPVVASHV